MRGERQGEHEHVAVDLSGTERQQSGQCDRYDEKIDQNEIKREQPRGAPDFVLAVVFDNGDVELARQQNDGEQRQQRHCQKRARRRLAGEHGSGIRPFQGLRKKRERPVEHPERDEYADADEGNEFDDRLGCDCQHQSVLVLGGIDMARPEEDGEDRHCDRHVKGDVPKHWLHHSAGRSERNKNRGQRGRDRLELKRYVRHRADDRDERHGGSDRLRFAITGGNEVGDRRNVLCLGQAHDPHDQRRAQPDQKHRADVNGQEIEAGARSKPHRAKERPRGAVDRKRERIDEPPATFTAKASRPVSVTCNQE